jgi:hypothetical protein
MRGQDIITRVRDLTNDDGTKWPDTELVRWINDGCLFLAIVRPDSCATRGPLALAAGFKQTLPAGALRLLDVLHNTTGYRAVRFVERQTLDAANPSWRAAKSSATILNYVYDNRDPLHFDVYPPAAAGASVEARYVSKPVAITTAQLGTVDLTPDDTYQDVLVNYVAFRCYSKDSAFGAAEVAAAYRGLVSDTLGLKTGSDAKNSPDWNNPGGVQSAAQQQGGV